MWNLIISLILAIISYVKTKKGNAKNEGKAIAAAAATGLGANYLLTNTEWGKDSVSWLNDNVANLDGETTTAAPTTTLSPDGKAQGTKTTVVTNPDGTKTTTVSPAPATQAASGGTGLWETLKSWGPTGTATVIGTAGVATGKIDKKWLWLGGGVIVFLLLMK